jgi:hypothetical protein
MKTKTIKCLVCGHKIDPLDIFPESTCKKCYALIFDAVSVVALVRMTNADIAKKIKKFQKVLK